MTNNNLNGTTQKVVSLTKLAGIITSLKDQNTCVVQCHGVFDLLHSGHIRHLESARREGDVLIVTITADEFVDKGPGRPVFGQGLRAETLAALQCVDYVAVNQRPTAVEAIKALRPNVYVKGNEYGNRESDVTGKIHEEEATVIEVGGRIHFTDGITFSSSHLINTYLHVFPPEVEEWLQAFRERYSSSQVLEYIGASSGLKVLVIGEAVIDEYVFCHGLGKSTKDPILALQFRSQEAYAGGSLAIANHLASLCDEVGLITFLGDSDRREDFVRASLAPNVHPYLLTKAGTPTIHKRRYVDEYSQNKLFELYIMDDSAPNEANQAELSSTIQDVIADYDVVIATDYGHGMITHETVATLCDRARFLAVNTQANAGNRGFNTITKYPRADYVCLANHEIAIETRLDKGDPRDLLLEVTQRIDCQRFTVTQGKDGSLHYQPEHGFTHVPALATRVTDRVGGGDSVLAVTSLLVAQDTPWEIVGFIGNVAGSQVIAELGNRVPINKGSLSRHIVSLMQ